MSSDAETAWRVIQTMVENRAELQRLPDVAEDRASEIDALGREIEQACDAFLTEYGRLSP